MNAAAEDIDLRTGLPSDLKGLLEKFPREQWSRHENLGQLAQFWLRRHDMFRELGPMLKRGMTDWRNGPEHPAEIASWMAPRISFFLGELDGHHNVEDHHFFPLLRRVEPSLARGFDLLDKDHGVIHEALEANAESANRLFASLEGTPDKARTEADRYVAANDRLITLLSRHLTDEEDLVIPLILDRGEAVVMTGA